MTLKTNVSMAFAKNSTSQGLSSVRQSGTLNAFNKMKKPAEREWVQMPTKVANIVTPFENGSTRHKTPVGR